MEEGEGLSHRSRMRLRVRLYCEGSGHQRLACARGVGSGDETTRDFAYKRGATGVVQIQNISRFGQREDGQCLSRSTIQLHGSRCPHKLAKTGPSTSINTQANKNGRVSGARANSRSSGSL